MSVQTKVTFLEFRYEVMFVKGQISKFYDQNLAPAEIEEAAMQEGNRLLDFIRAKAGRV
jgi:hypothetical protein